MLHIFCTNLVKVVTRKSKMTLNKGRREYVGSRSICADAHNSNSVVLSFCYSFASNCECKVLLFVAALINGDRQKII